MLEYLTVFRSRVANANVVLPLVELGSTRTETILRKLRETLDKKIEIDVADKRSERVLTYLVEKQLIGKRPRRSGRYRKYTLVNDGGLWIAASATGECVSRLPVFQTDLWFSDPRLRSTVGLPTPDNSEEVFEFCVNLGMVSRARGARTTEGQTAVALRGNIGAEENPFVMGLESAVLLRQLIERDGLILRELSQEILDQPLEFRRDDLLPDRFIAVARRAYEGARRYQLRPDDVTQARNFLRLLEETAAKKARSRSGGVSSTTRSAAHGPGVLEHRLSPRLEWLTDFGVLSKDGIRKNSFAYRKTPVVGKLAALLGEFLEGAIVSDDVALAVAVADTRWNTLRQAIRANSVEQALVEGYRQIQMSIGPVSIREVCFLAALQLEPVPLMGNLRGRLLEWAQREHRIRLSGGRYSREPEMVYFSDKVFHE